MKNGGASPTLQKWIGDQGGNMNYESTIDEYELRTKPSIPEASSRCFDFDIAQWLPPAFGIAMRTPT
jgi:hypothetical protein